MNQYAKCILALSVCALMASPAGAQEPVKIAVLTDIAGPFSSNFGMSSVEAARLAVKDFGGTAGGMPVEVIFGDHQNKPDVGAALAQRWFENEGVDAVVDMPNSSVALAVQSVAINHKKVALYAGAVSEQLSHARCSPYTSQWVYTNNALAAGAGKALVQQGDDTWYFLTTDFTFGHELKTATTRAVETSGGTVIGESVHPVAAPDFSSYLLQAMSSGAKVIGIAGAGGDLQNIVKSSVEFGLAANNQKLAALVLQLNDVNALGLEAAQNLVTTTSFYWDQDEGTRAFAERYRAAVGKPPGEMQAGIYSAVTHYLKGIEATGSKEPKAVTDWMKANPVDDFYGRGAMIREDGIMMHDMYLLQVKTPEESSGQWDYMKVLKRIPAEDAFPPASTECPLVKQ